MKRYKESRFTQEYIRSIINYDPLTGKAHWKRRSDDKLAGNALRGVRMFNTRNAGNEIKTVDGRGYIVTSIANHKIALHRVLFVYMEGLEPDVCDHINGVITDNRWCNIRAVTASENKQNIHRGGGVTGYTGVRPVLKVNGNNFKAVIRVNGKPKHLGMFDTAEQAALAYNDAIDLYRNGFGRKNVVFLSEPV